MIYFSTSIFFETVVLIAIACMVVLLGRSFDDKIIKAKGDRQKRLKKIKIVVEIFKYALLIMVGYAILQVNGIDVSKLMRNLGIAGIVVGFALNDYLKDIVMGITIMLEGYYKVGDSVIYQGMIGKVVSFSIKTTKLYIYETEETRVICNRNITEISKAADWVDICVPIGYDVDPIYARAICKKCAKRIERLRYVYSCDFLNTQSFEASYINYKLRIHHLIEKQFMVKRNANSVVQDVFREHELAFPYGVTVLYDGKEIESRSKMLPVESVLPENHVDRGDYELGHGADKSKTIPIDGSQEALATAMKETERYSKSENLNKKMEMRMRLLSEEVLSLVQGIDNIKDGSFHIERNEADYEIILDAMAVLSKEKKKSFKQARDMASATDPGMTDMLKSAITAMMAKCDRHKTGGEEQHNAMDDSIISADDNYGWSYNVYKEKENANKPIEELMKEDVLEKSVISAFADDIKLSMTNNKLKIRVLVKNIEEEE